MELLAAPDRNTVYSAGAAVPEVESRIGNPQSGCNIPAREHQQGPKQSRWLSFGVCKLQLAE